jgi:hypothetical protein
MKSISLLIILLILNNFAKADYGNCSLPELICKSDYGAIGTIVKLDNNYFYLKVEKFILNKIEIDTIPIVKFQDWSCAWRYDKYQIGQRELVFFRKSNYVIDDYEYLGYGGGDEFELPIFGDTIKYQTGLGEFDNYNINYLKDVLYDYELLIRNKFETSEPINENEKIKFIAKSKFHKEIANCKEFIYTEEVEFPETGFITNVEQNYLYENFENKIYISCNCKNNPILVADNCDIWKEKNYYIIRPKSGWTQRILNVYCDSITENPILYQSFKVIKLPEPRIYMRERYIDSFLSLSDRISPFPKAYHYLDEMHINEYLKYELLNYDYIINSNGMEEVLKFKSSVFLYDVRERLGKLKVGDIITLKNIYVLYPNKEVKKIKDKTIYVRQ